MPSWWIVVSAETPEERDRAADPKSADHKAADHKAAVLAAWDTGVGGAEWLMKLVEDGTAKEYRLRGGYPNRYTALAGDVLPLFADGPPLARRLGAAAGSNAPAEPNQNVALYRDRIAACPPGQVLTIDVWDQS